MPASPTDTVVGLRVDVDTLRGTRDGVPKLLDIFAAHGIRASIFFSVGPDNMGRHLWRLLKPAFLWKMLRSNAPGLYGWDILLRGTFWPGREIGRDCAEVIASAAATGHEVGLHAWDHHAWQAKLAGMSDKEINDEVGRGMQAMEALLGAAPVCSAAAGWQCNESVLVAKEAYGMRYNSDCRGSSIFRPLVRGRALTPQIPVTLPTYDEIVGRNGVNDSNYNERLLAAIRPGKLNVLTIHAEVEGIAKSALFERFLKQAASQQVQFTALGELLPDGNSIPSAAITQGSVTGRAGMLCTQTGT